MEPHGALAQKFSLFLHVFGGFSEFTVDLLTDCLIPEITEKNPV
jgi:hypothetical protein